MKKTLLLLTVIFNTILSFAQPLITNSSFEDWATRYTKLAPVGWQCDSVGLVTTSVKKVSIPSAGSYAIQIGTISYAGGVISSYISREDSITSAPGNLTFDYKVYNNVTSQFNGLYLEIYFKDSKKKDLRDFNWTSSGNNSTYAAGNMAISFNTGQIPKYYMLRISYFNVGGVAGEYAIIDNLKFSKPSSIMKTLNNSLISVFPNPATGSLNFTDKAKDKLAKVRLISATGQNFEFPVTNSSIDISGLSKGIYVAELIDFNNQILRREKVSVLN